MTSHPSSAPRPPSAKVQKQHELAPHVEQALQRRRWMRPLADDEIPVVGASRAKAEVNRATLDR